MICNTAAFIQNLRRIVLTKIRHQSLKFVIEPAHQLDIDIFLDSLRLSLMAKLLQLRIQCFGKFSAHALVHSRHPFLKR